MNKFFQIRPYAAQLLMFAQKHYELIACSNIEGSLLIEFVKVFKKRIDENLFSSFYDKSYYLNIDDEISVENFEKIL